MIPVSSPVTRQVLVHGGLRFDYHEKWGVQTNPTLGFSYSVLSQIRLRGSVGRIFRAPTFTELFYHDDYNHGNASLKPEIGWSGEVGVSYSYHQSETEMTLFVRNEKDRIQWMRQSSETIWHAENISSAQFSGLTMTHRFPIGKVFQCSGYYAFIHRNQTVSEGNVFKYSSQIPQHHIKLSATLNWPVNLSQNFFRD